jgi:hypothetical protein
MTKWPGDVGGNRAAGGTEGWIASSLVVRFAAQASQ